LRGLGRAKGIVAVEEKVEVEGGCKKRNWEVKG